MSGPGAERRGGPRLLDRARRSGQGCLAIGRLRILGRKGYPASEPLPRMAPAPSRPDRARSPGVNTILPGAAFGSIVVVLLLAGGASAASVSPPVVLSAPFHGTVLGSPRSSSVFATTGCGASGRLVDLENFHESSGAVGVFARGRLVPCTTGNSSYEGMGVYLPQLGVALRPAVTLTAPVHVEYVNWTFSYAILLNVTATTPVAANSSVALAHIEIESCLLDVATATCLGPSGSSGWESDQVLNLVDYRGGANATVTSHLIAERLTTSLPAHVAIRPETFLVVYLELRGNNAATARMTGSLNMATGGNGARLDSVTFL